MCTVLYQQFCPIAERACFSTIMYWLAHVGTQENGWHDVMKNAKMVAYTSPGSYIATAIGNKKICSKWIIIQRVAKLWNSL